MIIIEKYFAEKWYGVTLSAENKKQFLIPEGFAYGFLVLSDEAEFCYNHRCQRAEIQQTC